MHFLHFQTKTNAMEVGGEKGGVPARWGQRLPYLKLNIMKFLALIIVLYFY